MTSPQWTPTGAWFPAEPVTAEAPAGATTPQWTPVGAVAFPLVVPFSHGGALLPRTGKSKFPITGGPWRVMAIAGRVDTPPQGGPVIFDVNVNGTSIYPDPAARPTIPADATLAVAGDHTPTTVTDGDYLTVDIDQIGETAPGTDLVVSVRLQRTGP